MRKLLALGIALAVVGCAKGNSTAGPSASPPAAVLHNPASANDGARIYQTNCSSCHQPDGQGVPGAFPPLAGNPVVTGDPRNTIAIVKFGMSGRIVAEGETYNGTMPHWGQMISDDDIAAVVTFIRSSWHNRGSAVSVADVIAVSK